MFESDKFVLKKPSDQNSIDCFKNLWYSSFPSIFNLSAGDHKLFFDARLEWAFTKIKSKSDWDVLELGPLEGGHSYWLEKNTNVRSVTAIEANQLCWLKCLVTKEVVDLKKTKYLLGDFIEFLKDTKKRYDLILALGVLYHMKNPLELIKRIAETTERAVIWTQFADKDKQKEWQKKTVRYQDLKINGYVNDYGSGNSLSKFIGGLDNYSVWMTKEDILSALKLCGFTGIEVGNVSENKFGGEITLVATK